jgi:hypothetical protein
MTTTEQLLQEYRGFTKTSEPQESGNVSEMLAEYRSMSEPTESAQPTTMPTPSQVTEPIPQGRQGWFGGDVGLIQKGAEGIAESFTGAERTTPEIEELPEVSTARGLTTGEFGKDIKVAAGLMFGQSDQAKIDIIKNQFELPDEAFDTDQHGTTIITFPNGKRAVLNKPGMSFADVQSVLGDLALFYGPAKVAAIPKLAGMGARRVAAAGIAEAGTEFARQKGVQQIGSEQEVSPLDVGVAGATGVAGELVATGARAVKGVKQAAEAEKAGFALEDVVGVPGAEEAAKKADMLTGKTGIKFARPQKTGIISDQGLMRYITQLPAVQKKSMAFLEQQNKDSYEAVKDVMKMIAPPEAVETAATGVRKAAQKVVRKQDQIRIRAASRFYQEAFKDQTLNTIDKTTGYLDGRIEKLTKGDKRSEFIKAKELLTPLDDAKGLTIEQLDQAYKGLGGRHQALQREGKRELANEVKGLQQKLLREITELNPSYKKGVKVYAQLSKPWQEMVDSKVGAIANLKDKDLKTISTRLFDATEFVVTPQSVKNAKAVLQGQNPEAWNAIVRAEFQKRLGKVRMDPESMTAGENIPAKLRTAIFGNQTQRETLYAALDGEAKKNLRYLEESLKKAEKGRPGGSPTQPNRVYDEQLRKRKGLFGAIGAPVRRVFEKGPMKAIGEAGDEKVFRDNLNELAETMFDPTWTAEWERIRRMAPDSKETATAMQKILTESRKKLGKPAVQAARRQVTQPELETRTR